MKKSREPVPAKVLIHTVKQASLALSIGPTKLYEVAPGLDAVAQGRGTWRRLRRVNGGYRSAEARA